MAHLAAGLTVFLVTEMIIFLSINEDNFFDPSDATITLLFSELARSSRMGFHRVVIPRQIAKWAAANLEISIQDKKHIERIGQEYTQLGGLAHEAGAILRVLSDGSDLVQNNEGNWSIGYTRLLESNYLERTTVLLENGVNDGGFFTLLFSHEAKRKNFGDVSFHISNGGGGSTAAELRRIAADKRIVLCICDHDMLTPYGCRSETCNAVFRTAEEIEFVGYATSTPSHEAENILPIEIVAKTKNSQIDEATFDYLKLMQEQGEIDPGDCMWLYFDAKNGIEKTSLSKYCTQIDSIRWISNKYKVAEELFFDVNFPGYGNNIIYNFMNNNELQSEFYTFTRSRYWHDHFSDWFDNILWYLCGRKQQRLG